MEDMYYKKNKPNILEERRINAIPDHEEYYALMYNRFTHALWRFGFLKHPFFLLINAIPRKETITVKRTKNNEIKYTYVGINGMKAFLQKECYAHQELPDEVDQALENIKTRSASENSISSLLTEYHDKDLELEDIYTKALGQLCNYFSGIKNENKQLEEIILAPFPFDVYWHISVPLIIFGEVDGVVHIVLHKEDVANLGFDLKTKLPVKMNFFKHSIGNIIKTFSYEAEAIMLDWEMIGENIDLISAVRNIVDEVCSPEFQERLKNEPNQIFQELNYIEYYLKNEPYYRKRLEQSDEVTERIYMGSLLNAIVTILIDSYAHNVSAHSLTSINWQLKLRAENLRQRAISKETLENDRKAIEKYFNRAHLTAGAKDAVLNYVKATDSYINKAKPTHSSTNYIVDYPGSLSSELQPLVGYLMEKGAFWSGVTRIQHYGGTIIDLFSLLWNDFLSNPLYLGTIARSEGISKIKLKIIIYEKDTEFRTGAEMVKKTFKQVDGQPLMGILGEIDIKKSRKRDISKWRRGQNVLELSNGTILKLPHEKSDEEIDILRDRSDFLQPGPNYFLYKKELTAIKLFLPGGVVGKHALFTIIENEIRNIKHYTNTGDLKSIQDNGLTLALSIQEVPLNEDLPGHPLYQLGVWIHEPNTLSQKTEKDESPHLILQKYKLLHQDIIDPKTRIAQLGGNNQDKICASMLFNNTFQKVQNGHNSPFRNIQKDNDRDRLYYPWIVSATAINGATQEEAQTLVIEDFQLKGNQVDITNFDRMYAHKGNSGYLKKLFHCWKGEEIKQLSPDYLSTQSGGWNEWENISRFKFLSLQGSPEEQLDLYHKVRTETGVIRIIKYPVLLSENESTTAYSNIVQLAYKKWLRSWLGPQDRLIQFEEATEQIVGNTRKKHERFAIYFSAGEKESGEIRLIEPDDYDTIPACTTLTLELAHGGKGTQIAPNKIRTRTHGAYRRYYDEETVDGNRFPDRMLELMETLFTKVVIFDSRARHRIRDSQEDRLSEVFARKLNLNIYSEKIEHWNTKKKEIEEAHFVVIHLTFIENLIKEKYRDKLKKGESWLGYFIEKEIPQKARERENFVLVITTGRGRMNWWTELQESQTKEHRTYLRFTTFRPIEPILNALENAQSKEDDLDLKHFLIKTLFGS